LECGESRPRNNGGGFHAFGARVLPEWEKKMVGTFVLPLFVIFPSALIMVIFP
jgi:hypothetical protein